MPMLFLAWMVAKLLSGNRTTSELVPGSRGVPSPEPGSGSLFWWPMPVIEVRGKRYAPTVSDGYGAGKRRIRSGPNKGQLRTHAGVDIMYKTAKTALPQYLPPRDRSDGRMFFLPPFVPVLAAREGTVWSVMRTERGYGVEIVHDKGQRKTFYQHLAGVLVRKGQVVERGEALGTAGYDPSGNAPRHLHFERSDWNGSGWTKLDPGDLSDWTVGPMVYTVVG